MFFGINLEINFFKLSNIFGFVFFWIIKLVEVWCKNRLYKLVFIFDLSIVFFILEVILDKDLLEVLICSNCW